ncbi:MAG: hypothetical protein KJO34_06785, partial [Deltaproteobacteria bacterium]|nr:hypothetical protein [Deltaproteobacteria bacterium]
GKLLQEYILPAMGSTEPLPANTNITTRLDDLVAKLASAPDKGIIWSTAEAGIAKNGLFERKATPGFQFRYPTGSVKIPTRVPDQIMRMETPKGSIVTASIFGIPRDWRRFFLSLKLKDFGPKVYASWLNDYGSQMTVVSNNELSLTCGTHAYRTDITWVLNNRPIRTTLLSTYKHDKCVYIAVHQYKRTESSSQSCRVGSSNSIDDKFQK